MVNKSDTVTFEDALAFSKRVSDAVISKLEKSLPGKDAEELIRAMANLTGRSSDYVDGFYEATIIARKAIELSAELVRGTVDEVLREGLKNHSEG